MDYSATDIPGNRLKIQKSVTVFLGYPNSERTEAWEKGFVSPPVYSWVQEGGEVYWQIGELKPQRYVRHDPKKLDVIPDSGGAEYLRKESEMNWLDKLGLAGIDSIGNVIRIALIIVVFLISMNVYSSLK